MENEQLISQLKELQHRVRKANGRRAYTEEASRQFVRAWQREEDIFNQRQEKHDFLVKMLDTFMEELYALEQDIGMLVEELGVPKATNSG